MTDFSKDSTLRAKCSRFLSSTPGKILTAVLALLPALLAAVIVLYYIWGPAEGYFHSDCTDNLLWANASLESGHVFDESFRYAGLLPFSSTVWMIPLVKIFGVSMTAQNIGMSIFAVLFMASVYFFCRVSGFGRFWSSSVLAVTTLFLSSSDKLREIMYGHTIYYSMGPCILFALGGFFLLAQKAWEKKKPIGILWTALIAFLCAGTATDGGQVIVIGSLPVIAGILAERFFCGKDKLLCRKNGISVGLAAVAGVGTLIGLRILAFWKGENIDCGYANAYSGWSDVSAWVSNAQNFVRHYFSLLGVSTDMESLFSKESIGAILRILGGIVILAVPLVMLVLYKKIQTKGVRIALWAHLVVTAAVLFGFICGNLSGANWRLTPIVATAAALSVMGARELCVNGLCRLRAGTDGKEAVPGGGDAAPDCLAEGGAPERPSDRGRVFLRLGAILLAVLMLFSLLVFKEIKKMPADYGQDNYNHTLARFLEDKGLEYGYATFWFSQSITALSDSRVKCREVLAERGGGVYSDYYQSSRKWYVNQNYDKYFILLSEYEYGNVSQTVMWGNAVQYKIAEYRAASAEEQAAGLGVPGYVITVFDRNVLDPAVMG